MRPRCLLAMVAVSTACDDPRAPQEVRASASVAPSARPAATPRAAVLGRPRTRDELKTTSEGVFFKNLDSRIEAARKAVASSPEIGARYAMLGRPLLVRAKAKDKLDDVAETIDVATRGLEKQPKNRALLMLRADARSTLGVFERALEDARAADAIRSDDASRAVVADLRWNLGEHDEAIKTIRKLAKQRPTFLSLARLAELELDLGRVEQARRAFGRAETQIRDVSPVAVAWLNVRRGVLGRRTGDLEGARPFYEEAVDRLPSSPAALGGLAEIEALLGKPEKAVERYRAVLKVTDHPAHLSALARLLAEQGEQAEARSLIAEAKKRYEKLLREYPEATYQRAAEFFLDEGADPKRALALLEADVRKRPAAGSLAALAAAQLENGKIDEALVSIEKALATPIRRAEIFWTAARIYTKKGKSAEADEAARKAKQLNPKIEALEGKLAAE